LVCVHDWQHRIVGLDTQTRTLEFRCQSCGAEVTLHPQNRIFAERLMGWLLIPAIFPSVYFFVSARRKERAWTDHPLVDGAQHTPAVPDGRRCVCSRAAPCIRIMQRRMQGIPVGTRYQYRCSACSRAFTVHDNRSIVFWAITAIVLCAAGALVLAFPPGSAVGAERSNQWFGAALVVFGAIGWLIVGLAIRGRIEHPPVD
jgi:DNA-directed RNA polymerase subunit RPC12/RpoP